MYIRDIKERRYRETGTGLSLSPSLSINSIYITVNIHFFFPISLSTSFPSLSRSKGEERRKYKNCTNSWRRERERGEYRGTLSRDEIRKKKKEEEEEGTVGALYSTSPSISLSPSPLQWS